VRTGGYLWPRENERSPGHSIALENGSRFKIRTGGPESSTFVDSHIEAGGWVVDEGPAQGRHGSANEAVRAVHGGTSLNAWLYVVLQWDGSWKDANEVRRLQATKPDFMEESRLIWCAKEIRKKPEAKGVGEDRIMIVAATMAARMSHN
jgi:hypothetical protein